MIAPARKTTDRTITVERSPPRRGFLRRRSNRRIIVSRPSVLVWVGEQLRALGRKLLFVGKVLAVVALLAASAFAGRRAVRHVIASPRFAVRDIRVGPTTHVSVDEIHQLAGVRIGDRLLAVDPDAVAARLTTHPWILSARVRRELPSALTIDVTERRAVASVLLGALYLLDEAGHPFKRATLDEADGLPVLTGITRDQYAAMRPTSEAALGEALGLLAAYAGTEKSSGRESSARPAESDGPDRSTWPGKHGGPREPDAAGSGRPERPALSEIHIDPRAGFTAVLLDGGGEIRLGRGGWQDKLDKLDRILAAVGPRGPAALASVYLDGPPSDRVTIRLKPAPAATDAPGSSIVASGPASKKFRVEDKRGED